MEHQQATNTENSELEHSTHCSVIKYLNKGG